MQSLCVSPRRPGSCVTAPSQTTDVLPSPPWAGARQGTPWLTSTGTSAVPPFGRPVSRQSDGLVLSARYSRGGSLGVGPKGPPPNKLRGLRPGRLSRADARCAPYFGGHPAGLGPGAGTPPGRAEVSCLSRTDARCTPCFGGRQRPEIGEACSRTLLSRGC